MIVRGRWAVSLVAALMLAPLVTGPHASPSEDDTPRLATDDCPRPVETPDPTSHLAPSTPTGSASPSDTVDTVEETTDDAQETVDDVEDLVDGDCGDLADLPSRR